MIKRYQYIGILVAILLISLATSTFKYGAIEGLVNLDGQYLALTAQPLDANLKHYLSPGYYPVGTDQMARIPPGYIVTPDQTGIILDVSNPANSDNVVNIKPDSAGNYTVPTGYYSLGNNQMAIIPYGFQVNASKTGITLNPIVNVINAPISQNSPTSNLTDGSYNSLIKYNSNKFDVKYHEDLSLNDQLNAIHPNSIYYEPGTFKYGGSSYVPSYEDSVYLSKTTYLPSVSTFRQSGKTDDLCEKYRYQPNQLENACNNLDNMSCRKSKCCVSLGGSKCVAGNESGPSMKYNYSDYLVKNRDYYYYNGKCYGNCPYYETDINL